MKKILTLTRILFLAAVLFFCTVGIAIAATSVAPVMPGGSSLPNVTLEIPIEKLTSANIATYIENVYKWLVGLAAVLAVVAFTYGGLLWLIAGGEAGRVNESKKVMGNAIVGLLLALGSYVFLSTINPNLVTFQSLSITPINPLNLNLAPVEAVPTGGDLHRGCHGTLPTDAKCSTDNPCECQSGYCTVAETCADLPVASAKKVADLKGLCCFVLNGTGGTKTRSAVDENNSKACLDLLKNREDLLALSYKRFFCPDVKGITINHCWEKEVDSSDPGFYQRSNKFCKTYIDFTNETTPAPSAPAPAPMGGGHLTP